MSLVWRLKMNKRQQLEDYYDQYVWKHQTLDEFIVEKAQRYAKNIAIIDEDIEITYEDLIVEIENYACEMQVNGLKKGDKVLVQLPNCIEFIIIIFALFKIGAIPILALATHRKNEIKGIIQKSDAVAYIAKKYYLGFLYEPFIEEIEIEINCKLDKYILESTKHYKNFYSKTRNDYVYQLNAEQQERYKETALLLLSGGTTGIPKLIPRRHCDYIYAAEQSAKRSLLGEDAIYLVALPMAHNFPLGCPGIIGTFSVGGTVVICNITSPDEILPLIEEQKVTHTALVPSIAKLCIDFHKQYSVYDISSLKLVQVGGAPLDTYTSMQIEEQLDCVLQQVYGIAEGLISMTSPTDYKDIIYETQGTPISEYDEIKIVDEQDEEVDEGNCGELLVRGPYTIYNYFNAPHMYCVDKDMYFKTGDKVCKQHNGCYRVVGRIKEMINKSGEKILPNELETILLTHKQIKDVKVIGLKDDRVGEKICVCVDKNANVSIHELRKYLKQQGIADFKLPDCLKKVNDWPLTSLGKIDVKKLKALIN